MAMVPQGYRILLIMKSPIFLAAMAGILITALLWPREHLDDAEGEGGGCVASGCQGGRWPVSVSSPGWPWPRSGWAPPRPHAAHPTQPRHDRGGGSACDSSIGVSWDDGATSPVFAGNATVANSTFNVSTVKLTGVDAACNGQNFKVVAAASTGTQLQVASGTISGAPRCPSPSRPNPPRRSNRSS